MTAFEFSVDVVDRIMTEIRNAEAFVRIAIFQLHDPKVFEALNEKLRNGIRVEIFTLPYDSINEDVRERVSAQFEELKANGAMLYLCRWNVGDPERTSTAVVRWYSFHGKFIVTDKSAIALSANFTEGQELDAILIFNDDSGRIREYNTKFDELVALFITRLLCFG